MSDLYFIYSFPKNYQKYYTFEFKFFDSRRVELLKRRGELSLIQDLTRWDLYIIKCSLPKTKAKEMLSLFIKLYYNKAEYSLLVRALPSSETKFLFNVQFKQGQFEPLKQCELQLDTEYNLFISKLSEVKSLMFYLNRDAILYVNENIKPPDVFFNIILNINEFNCGDKLMIKIINKFQIDFVFTEDLSKVDATVIRLIDLSFYSQLKRAIEDKYLLKPEVLPTKLRRFTRGYFSIILYSYFIKHKLPLFINKILANLPLDQFEIVITSLGFAKEFRCFSITEFYQILQIAPKAKNETIELQANTMASLISLLADTSEQLNLIFKEHQTLLPYLSYELQENYKMNKPDYAVMIDIESILEMIDLNNLKVVTQLVQLLRKDYFALDNKCSLIFTFDSTQTFKFFINNTQSVSCLHKLEKCYQSCKEYFDENNALGYIISNKRRELLLKLMTNENQKFQAEQYINSLLSFHKNHKEMLESCFKNAAYEQKLIVNLSMFTFSQISLVKDKLLQLQLNELFTEEAYIKYYMRILETCSKIEELYHIINLFFTKLPNSAELSIELLKHLTEHLWVIAYNRTIYKELPEQEFNKLFNTILHSIKNFPEKAIKLSYKHLADKMNELDFEDLLRLAIDEIELEKNDVYYLQYLLQLFGNRLSNINSNKSNTAISLILKILSFNKEQSLKDKLTALSKAENQLITIVLEKINLAIPQEFEITQNKLTTDEVTIVQLLRKGLLFMPELKSILFIQNVKSFYSNLHEKWFQNKLISIVSLYLFAQLPQEVIKYKLELICMNGQDVASCERFIMEHYRSVNELNEILNKIKNILPDLFKHCAIDSINESINSIEMTLRSGLVIDLNEILGKQSTMYLRNAFYPSIEGFELLIESAIFRAMMSNEETQDKEKENISQRLDNIQIAVEEYKQLASLFTTLDETIISHFFKGITNVENELLILSKITQNEGKVNIPPLVENIKLILNFCLYYPIINEVEAVFAMFDIPPGQINVSLKVLRDTPKTAFNNQTLSLLFNAKRACQGLFEDPLKSLFHDLSLSKKLLLLLENKTLEQLKNYYGAIDITSEVQMEDINNLINIFSLFDTVKNSKSADEFINNINAIIRSNLYLSAQLNKAVKMIALYEEFCNRIERKEEYSKNTIYQFLHGSQVLFELTEYDVRVSFREEKDFEKKLIASEEELIEYSARAILLSKKQSYSNELQNEAMMKYEAFSKVVECIEQSKQLLQKNNSIGSPIESRIAFIIKDNDIWEVLLFDSNSNKKSLKYEEFIFSLKETLENMSRLTLVAYETYPLLTFFHTKQFNILYNYTRFKRGFDSFKHLISYLTNQIEIETYEAHNIIVPLEEVENNFIESKFFDISNYLDSLFKINSITFDEIFKDLICDENESPGLYLVPQSQQPELLIISILNQLLAKKPPGEFNLLKDDKEDDKAGGRSHFPTASIVLVCSNETLKEEILGFIYRWLNMKLKVPFFIINFSAVTIKIKHEILKFLQEKSEQPVNSLLFFILSDFRETTFNEKNLPKAKQRIFLEEKAQCLSKNGSDIEIIKSNCSGTGKSTAIKNYVFEMGFRYIAFPISFDSSFLKIIDRLKEIDFSQPKTLFHVIFLSDSFKNKSIDQIIFSLLITKCFSHKDKMYFLKERLKLVVELPYGFVDFEAKFPLLRLFKSTCISLNNLPEFNASLELSNKLNIICTYLIQDRKGLLRRNAILPIGYDTETYLYNLGGSQVEIQNYPPEVQKQIILSCFPNETPTYYQLFSFINLLSSQLELFSNSLFIHPVILSSKSVKNLEMRHVLLNNLITLAKFCTVPAYKNLIHSQEFASDASDQPDEQKALELFQGQDIITFDKLPSGVIVFNRDGQSLKIITGSSNCRPEDKEKFKQLLNTQSQTAELVNYKDIKQEEYYRELKEYFDLKVDTKNFLDAVKIPTGYVFTCDNFIKMIHDPSESR